MQQRLGVIGSVGHLAEPVKPRGRQGVHQSYAARAWHPLLGAVDVQLKMLSGKRLANELMTAVLGDELGARVPNCFAVAVDASLDAEHECEGRRYGFASCLVPGAVTLAAGAVLANPHASEDFFKFKDWQPVVILDALVANSDRTPENLLRDANGHLWAIDHDAAFGGDWDVFDLLPSRYSTNLLARPGSLFPSEEQRHELLRVVRSRPAALPVAEVAALLPPIELLTRAEAKALSLYVDTRWRDLDDLLRFSLFSQA